MRTVFSEANYDDICSRSKKKKNAVERNLLEISFEKNRRFPEIDIEFSRHGSLPREIKRHPVVESSPRRSTLAEQVISI